MSLTLEPILKRLNQNCIQQMGLSDEEFALVESILGRTAKLYGNRIVFGYVVRALQL